MENKEDKILEAAWKLFLRHGFKKVTMSEIAEASGVSRPTVYAAFANKEAIITHMVEVSIENNQANTKLKLPKKKLLRDQLDCLFAIWIIEPFASIADSEGFKELMENVQEYAPVACNEIYSKFENHVVSLLKPHMKKKSELTVEELAKILTLATKGVKTSADTVSQLQRLIDGLIAMTMGMVEK